MPRILPIWMAQSLLSHAPEFWNPCSWRILAVPVTPPCADCLRRLTCGRLCSSFPSCGGVDGLAGRGGFRSRGSIATLRVALSHGGVARRPREPRRAKDPHAGSLDPGTRGARPLGPAVKCSPIAVPTAMDRGRPCDSARLPWTPDSFRRLAPRVSIGARWAPCGSKRWRIR